MFRSLYPSVSRAEFRIHRGPAAVLAGCGLLAMAACSGSGQRQQGEPAVPVTRGLDQSDRYLSTSNAAPAERQATNAGRPMALLNGQDITLEAMRPAMVEAAGALALEEVVLERLLEQECARAGVRIGPEQVSAERRVFVEALVGVRGAVDANEAERLLAQVRRERGLGDYRFEALLRRNAMLRALVAPTVRVTPEALRVAYERRYGEQFRCRVITVNSLSDASSVRRRLDSGETFSTIAAFTSTDSSAERGGVIPPISPADPSWPEAVRRTARELSVGQVSAPIALDSGYAILILDEVIPAPAGSPSSVDAAVETLEVDVRLEQERQQMGQLARRMLTEAKVSVIDRSLDRAWRERTGAP